MHPLRRMIEYYKAIWKGVYGQTKMFWLYLIKQCNYIYNIIMQWQAEYIMLGVYKFGSNCQKKVNAYGPRLEDNYQK